MTYWFGDFTPARILFSAGPVTIYWYSICLLVGILVAFFIARRLYLKTHTSDRELADLFFYVVIAGLIGARLWHVFVFQWAYYSQHVGEIIAIWQGGIAIQGAIIGGVIAIIVFAKKKKVSPWYFTDITAVGLALGQAIGRWGNFFNQELYGRPTDRPWGIFIDPNNRVSGYEQFTHFHPTFFYESILNLVLFFILWNVVAKSKRPGATTATYLIGYGIIRFLVDFVRIDPMPGIGVFRLSQLISLVFVIIGLLILIVRRRPGIAKA